MCVSVRVRVDVVGFRTGRGTEGELSLGHVHTSVCYVLFVECGSIRDECTRLRKVMTTQNSEKDQRITALQKQVTHRDTHKDPFHS